VGGEIDWGWTWGLLLLVSWRSSYSREGGDREKRGNSKRQSMLLKKGKKKGSVFSHFQLLRQAVGVEKKNKLNDRERGHVDVKGSLSCARLRG